jgi:hypothetical protein
LFAGFERDAQVMRARTRTHEVPVVLSTAAAYDVC